MRQRRSEAAKNGIFLHLHLQSSPFALALGLLAACAAHVAGATTWYVSSTGDDSAAGTSEDTALLTPAKGVSKAKAGDTVLLLPGTYPLAERLSIGTSDLTLKGATGNPRDVVLDGQGTQVGMELQGADGIVVSSLTLSNACEATVHHLTRACGITLGERSEPTESGKTKVVTNCVFTACKAWCQNGEMIVKMDVTSRVVDCLFENCTNTSGTAGAVVKMIDGGELVGCTIRDSAGVGVFGLVKTASATSMVVRACTIRGNTGRGVHNVPTVVDCRIENGTAPKGAGYCLDRNVRALLPADFRATVSNTVFSGNVASETGSAAYLGNGGALVGCTLSNNVCTATGDSDAVVYGDVADAGATSIVVRACTVRGNTGRGLFNVPTVLDSRIEGCTAARGAGAYYQPQILGSLPADFRVTVSNTLFLGNAATDLGGAVSWGNWCVAVSNLVVDSCAFVSNSVSRSSDGRGSDDWRGGGALFINPNVVGDNVVIRNSLFEGNVQLDGGAAMPGSAVRITSDARDVSAVGGRVRIESCTFAGNRNESGHSSGNAVFLTGRYTTPIAYVTNCTFASNLKVSDGEETEVAGLETQSSALAYSYLWPAQGGTYADTVINGTKTPKFLPGTRIPGPGSPLRDRGVTLDWMAGAKDLQRDADGRAFRDRVVGAAPDIGCYESWPLGLYLIVR